MTTTKKSATSVPRPVDEASVLTDLELREVSIAIIRAGQAASGAYVACPTYETYGFGWLRDGSFCAAAMDAAGERDSAAAFHAWVARTLVAHADKAERAIGCALLGGEVPHELLLPTRYTLEGAEEPAEDDAWPNFQLDGYGAWLWAVDQPLRRRARRGVRAGNPARRALPRSDMASALLRLLGGVRRRRARLDARRRSPRGSISLRACSATRRSRPRRDAVRARLESALIARRPAAQGSRRRPRGREPALGDRAARSARRRRSARPRDRGRGGGRSRRPDGRRAPLPRRHLLRRRRVDAPHRMARLAAGVGGRSRGLSRVQALDRGDGDPLRPTSCRSRSRARRRMRSMVDEWIERWGPVATPLLWSHAMWILMTLRRGGRRVELIPLRAAFAPGDAHRARDRRRHGRAAGSRCATSSAACLLGRRRCRRDGRRAARASGRRVRRGCDRRTTATPRRPHSMSSSIRSTGSGTASRATSRRAARATASHCTLAACT